MKKYLKENIKSLPFILVAFIMFYGITTLATNYLFNSNEVSYDNTETGLHADEVQGAIDEVFHHATDYSELKNKIGTNALTTTSQTLTGGINELKTNVTSLNDQIVPSEYLTTGLTYQKCSRVAGGYFRIGKIVVISMRITATEAIAVGDMMINGFPLALDNTIAFPSIFSSVKNDAISVYFGGANTELIANRAIAKNENISIMSIYIEY